MGCDCNSSLAGTLFLRKSLWILVLFVLEAQLRGSTKQFAVIDEMIRTAGFVRNSCILDRDENASRNLLAKGLEIVSRGGHSRINAQGHLNLCQISESLLDKFGG